MARTAQAWQTRPSALLSEDDEVIAFLLDEALALRLRVEELNSVKPRPKLPGGMQYEDADEVPARGPVARGPAAGIVEELTRA